MSMALTLTLSSPKGLKTPLPIQLGFPQLLEPGSDEFFQIIKFWLDDCDANHIDCKGSNAASLPTRLIDVGTRDMPALRLLEIARDKLEGNKYIALSHPWGDE